jgi:Tfp pilus assembly protein PilX
MTRGEDAVMLKETAHAGKTTEAGFALILAILALLLLTFLGLTMAVTTSTELQIAQNYRFSQQALYNAEAGVEIGKSVLRSANWTAVLPAQRAATWDGVTAPVSTGQPTAPFSRADAWGNVSRNFENWACDARGNGYGYGVVLDDGSASAPYQYITTFSGQSLNGAVTIWVRRLASARSDGTFEDFKDTDDTSLVLVAEGVAPYTGGTANSAFGRNRQAVQVIEVALSRGEAAGQTGCGNRSGQAGGSQFGAGFGGCGALQGGAGITQGMGGAATGSGAELNPNK